MGKNKNGLKKEKDLTVVRGAGFKRHKRKQLDEISENSRAGLNKKNKNDNGVECVKFKKPLALKHKRRIRKAAVALSAVFVAALSLFGYGFFVGGGDDFVADGIFKTSCFPTDAAITPDEFIKTTSGYSGEGDEENDGWKTIGYLNYTLINQPWYYSVMSGDIAISTPVGAMSQHVDTEKQFYNNVLISSEATTTPVSLMGIKIEEATQFAVISDPQVVLWRNGASSDSSTFHGKDTPWSTDRPSGATWDEYRKIRGNLQTEFSVYVINRDTILTWTAITKNADGTYSQGFKLNHEQVPYENSAVYYYQKQMQASGGLPTLPIFSSVEVTYTFDKDWQVLRSQIRENYTASYGPIDANGVSVSITDYSYDEAKAKNTFYEDYFEEYQSAFGTPAEKELTATDCLSSAFGSVLTGEAKLAVDLDLGGKTLSGIVHLNIDANDIRAELGNIKVYLMQGDGGKELYLSYGANTKIKIPLEAITGGGQPAAVSALAEGGEEGEEGGSFSVDDIMSQLMGGEFTVAEDKGSATLKSNLDLFGIKIALTFNFVIEDEVVSLGNVEAVISLMGTDIGATLRFTQNDVPALTKEQAETYVPLDVSAITNLISAEALKVGVDYEDGGLKAGGEVVINLKELSIKADLGIVLDGNEEAKKNISLVYAGGEIYLSVYSAGEQPVKIKADAAETVQLIKQFLGAEASGDNGSSALEGILSAIEKIGLGNILSTLLCDGDFADEFEVSDKNGFTLTVRGTELLEYFGGTFDLGDIELSLNGGEVYLSALGISGELTSCNAFVFDDSEYVSASDVIPVVDKIKDIIGDKGLSFNGNISLNFAGVDLNVNVELLSVKWADGIQFDLAAKLVMDGYSKDITASYNGERIALTFGEVGVYLNADQFNDFAAALKQWAGAATPTDGETVPLAEQLSSLLDGELDMFKIINALNIGGENGNITIKFGGLTLTVKDEAESDSGILGIEAQYSGADFSVDVDNAHLTKYVAPSPLDYEVDYFDGSKLLPLLNNITNIIENKGLNVSGSVDIDLKENGIVHIELTNASISWKKGIEVTAQIKVQFGELEKEIYVHYGQDGVQLYYDGIGVEVKDENLKEFATAAQKLYNAIAKEANLPELKDLSLQGIMDMFKKEESKSGEEGHSKTVAEKVVEVLKKLEITNAGDLTIKYDDITAVLVNSNGALSANVTYKDINATVNVSSYSKVEMPKTEYFDGAKLTPLLENITNIITEKGLTISGSVTIPITTGESKTEIGINISALSIKWNEQHEITFGLSATLTLAGKEHKIYAEYDGKNISLVYDGIGVNIAQANLKEFAEAAQKLYNAIAKEANLPELKELSLQGIIDMFKKEESKSGEEGQSKSVAEKVIEILNKLEITNEGDLTIKFDDITAVLVNNNGNLSANVKYKDITASVEVKDYEAVPMPDIEYFDGSKLIPLLNNITTIIENKGLNISGSVDIDLKENGKLHIELTNASISWKEGIEVTAQIKVKFGELEKEIYVHYGKDGVQLYYDGIGVNIAQANLKEFAEAAQKLYNAIAKEANLPELKELSLQCIMDMFKKEESKSGEEGHSKSVAEKVIEILNKLEITNAGDLTIKYDDITAVLVNSNGNLSANVTYKDISASVAVKDYEEVPMPKAEYFDGAKLTPLLENITNIITEKGLTVSGSVTIPITTGESKTEIGINISALSIRWNEQHEFTFGLSATLILAGKEHKIYAEYNGENISLVYDNIGVSLAKGEFTNLAAAAQKLYNAIAKEAKLPELKDLSLQGIMDMFKKEEPKGGEEGHSKTVAEKVVEVLNKLEITNEGDLTIKYDDITAVLVNSNGNLSVNVGYKDIKATVNVGAYSSIPMPKADYFDGAKLTPLLEKVTTIIANKGLTVSGNVDIAIKDNGTVHIELTNASISWKKGIEVTAQIKVKFGELEKEIAVHYGQDGVQLYYDGIGVEVKDGNLKEFATAAQKLYNAIAKEAKLPELKELSLQGIMDMFKKEEQTKDNAQTNEKTVAEKVVEVLNKLEITNAGDLTIKYGDITAVLVNNNGALSANVTYKDINATVNVSSYSKVEMPKADYFDGAKLTPLLEKVTTIIENKGLTISGSVDIDLKENGTVHIELTNASISWKEGIEVTAQIKVKYGELEKEIAVHYGQDGVQLYYDGIGVEVKDENLKEFATAAQKLYNAIAKEANLPELKDLSLQGIMDMFKKEEPKGGEEGHSKTVAEKVVEVLNKLIIAKNEAGNLNITYGDITAVLVNNNGNLSANVTYKDIKATVNVSSYSKVEMPKADYFDGSKLIPLLNNVTTIIENKGLNVSGNVDIAIKDNGTVHIELTNASISWKEGIEVTAQIKVKYGTLEKEIAVHYGQDGVQLYYDGIGVNIAQANLKEFATAAQKLYNAIAKEAKLPELTELSLQGIIDMFKKEESKSGAGTTEKTVAEKVVEVLNKLEITNAGDLTIKYGDITAVLINNNGALSANVEYKDIKATVNVSSYSKVEMPKADYFDGAKLTALLNNITNIIENKGLTISGNVTIPITTGESKTEIGINISALSIKWDEQHEFTFGLSATLTLAGKEHKIYAEYNGENISLVYDNIGVRLAKDEFNNFAAAAQKLYNAIAKEANLPELKELSLQGIMDMFKKEEPKSGAEGQSKSVAEKVVEVLNKLEITNAGDLTIKYDDITAVLVNSNGNLSANVKYKDITASVAVKDYEEVPMPGIDYFDGSKLLPLLNNITNIIENKGLTISGNVTIPITTGESKTEIGINITTLSIKWNEQHEFTFGLSATLTLVGKEHKIYAEYNGENISLVYDNIGVRLAKTEFTNFAEAAQKLYNAIAKEANLPELTELSLQGIMDMFKKEEPKSDGQDNDKTVAEKVVEVLNKLKITNAGDLTIKFDDITAVLVNNNGALSANVTYKDINATVNVSSYSKVEMPKADYFDGSKLTPLLNNVTTIIENKGLTISGSVTIPITTGESKTEIGINITALSIKWNEQHEFTFGLSATLTLAGKGHKIYAEYNGENISLVYDNIGVSLAKGEFTNFAAAAQKLYNAIAKEANLPELKDLSLQGIMDMFKKEEQGKDNGTTEKTVAEKVIEILNKLEITNAGDLTIKYDDITAVLVNNGGALSANVTYKDIKATVNISTCAEEAGKSVLPADTEVKYFSAVDLIPLMTDVTEIITNKGVTVGGTVNVTVGSTAIQVTVYGLSVTWENGIKLLLDARITADGTDHDIYAEYSAESNQLTVVYGSLQDGVGVQLNVKEDAATFEDALVKLYNRIAEVINTIVEDKPMKPAEDLNGVYENLTPVINKITDLIKTLENAFESVKDITGKIEDVKTEKLNIFDIINSLEYSKDADKFTVEAAGINLSVWKDALGFNLGVQTNGTVVELNGLTIIATSATESFFDVGVEPIDADGLCELVDYIGAAVEMLAKDTFKIELKGDVTSADAAYAEVPGNAKYTVSALFEYVQGASGYPVHLDLGTAKKSVEELDGNITEKDVPIGERDDVNFWISPDIYVHVKVEMVAALPEDDSMLFDIYIFDGNPAVSSGKTNSGALVTDGELDVYMSVGRIAPSLSQAQPEYESNPVKIYAPVKEIMTIFSAALAMVDVSSVETVNDVLNGVLDQLGGLLDNLLINKYLPYTQSQFASLGASLIPQLLNGKTPADILNSLFTKNEEQAQPQVQSSTGKASREQLAEGFNRVRKGLIGKFALTENEKGTAFELKVGETTATASKEYYTVNEVKRSRITELTIDHVEISDTETLSNFNIGISYEGVEKATSLPGYYDLSGIDTLLQTIVNSATHKEESAEETGATPGVADIISKGYKLNDNFFIDGSLKLSALGLLNVTVNIDGISVSLDENNNIEVNARLHYEGKRAVVELIKGDTSVDLTIKNGMIFIKRTQTSSFRYGTGLEFGIMKNRPLDTPIEIYRAMPISEFMSDIMNQIVFLFNFGDTIANAMTGNGGSTGEGGAQEVKKDYGTQFGQIFKSLKETATEAGMNWQIVLNGEGISALAGLDGLLSDITATLNASNSVNGHVLDGLDLSGSLFSILTITGNLAYENPQMNWKTDSAKADDICTNNPSVKLGEWLGGTSMDDINVDWAALKASSGHGYAEFTLNGENVAEGSEVRMGTLDFYRQSTPDSAEEESLGESCTVLFNGSKIVSKIKYPDISQYDNVVNKDMEWQISYVGGTQFKAVAKYVPEKYLVTIKSEYEIEGYVDNGECYVWQYYHSLGDAFEFDFNVLGDWHTVEYLEWNGEHYTADNYNEIEIVEDTEITVHWSAEQKPHTVVTLVSDYRVDGFTRNSQTKKYERTLDYELNSQVTLPTLDIRKYDFSGYYNNAEYSGEPAQNTFTANETGYTFYIKWIANGITVTYVSAIEFAGSEYKQTYEGYENGAYASTTTLYDKYETYGLYAEGYTFVGWMYFNGSEWIAVNDVKAAGIAYGSSVELHAVWAEITVNTMSAKRSGSGRLLNPYKYNVSYDISVNVLTSTSISGLSTTLNLGFFVSNNEDFGAAKQSKEHVDNATGFSVNGSSGEFSGDSYNSQHGYAHLLVGIKVSCNGREIGNIAASESSHYTCNVTT